MYVGLKEYLEEKGYSQLKMAEMLGVSPPYVNAILVGPKTLGKKGAKKWANLFGLSENFLLTGKGSPEPAKDIEYRQTIFQDTIQKANRLVQALNYLVDEGRIENFYAIAPILKVTDSVIHKAINYDPDGQVDFLFVKLTRQYPSISLEWLLTGDGEMIKSVEDDYREYLSAKLEEKEEKIANLKKDVESLKREVDDKKETIKAQKDAIASMKKEITRLEAENAKLSSEYIISKHHFPIGVAEPANSENEQVNV